MNLLYVPPCEAWKPHVENVLVRGGPISGSVQEAASPPGKAITATAYVAQAVIWHEQCCGGGDGQHLRYYGPL